MPEYCRITAELGGLVRGAVRPRGLAIMEKFSYLMYQPNYAW
jgi:hypothetical protein